MKLPSINGYKMNYCKNCGVELEPDMAYCPLCGHSVYGKKDEKGKTGKKKMHPYHSNKISRERIKQFLRDRIPPFRRIFHT